MVQILASGKDGSDKYDIKADDATKVLPALDFRQLAQSLQNSLEQTQGYSLSGEKGASDAIVTDLSIITESNIADYDESLSQIIQTYVANNSYLDVDTSSAANSIILKPRIIADIDAPNGNNYALSASLPFAFRDNLRFCFRATLTNTGATQIQITGLSGLSGAIDLVDEDGDDLVGGEIVQNRFYEIILTGTDTTKEAILVKGGLESQYLSGKNCIINGSMVIDQRNSGSAQTITAGAALSYTVDRWYAYCTGANVTGQRVSGSVPNQYNYQFTGAASVTKIGFAQRIEKANSLYLAGSYATLSVDLSNSLLTTVTWVAYYANSGDSFGTLSSPTRTQIATGTFTVTSSLTRYSTNISIPSGAYTGIEIEFSVGAQTSGTWTIGRVQLELGYIATQFEQRAIQEELFLCKRYFEWIGNNCHGEADTTTICGLNFPYQVEKRSVPAITVTASTFTVRSRGGDYDSTSPTIQNTSSGLNSTWTQVLGFTGLTVYSPVYSRNGSNPILGYASSEL